MSGRLGVVGGKIILPPNPYQSHPTIYTGTRSAGAGAHTMSPWAAIVTSCPVEATGISLTIASVGVSNTNTAGLIDIGVGLSGSEVVVASGIAIGMASVIDFVIPVRVPLGSRVSIRHQNAAASRTLSWRAQFLYGGPVIPADTVDVLGANSGTSLGTASATTGWAQVVAATPQDYQAVCVVWSGGGGTSMTATDAASLVAYGSVGNEVQVNGTYVSTTTSEAITAINGAGWDCGACPAGTRISLRKGGNTLIYGTIIGVPYP